MIQAILQRQQQQQQQQQQAAAAAAAAAAQAKAAADAAAAAQAALAAAQAAMPAHPVSALSDARAQVCGWRAGRTATSRRLGVTKANIAVLGIRGSGKSSFINALLSGVAGEPVRLAVSAPSDEHVTRQLYAYDVGQHTRLWDLWGWKSNYAMDVQLLQAGKLPRGVRFDNVPSLNDPRLIAQPQFAEHEMHAAIVTLSYGQHNPALFGEQLARIRELIRDAFAAYNVPVLVMLTMADQATQTNGVRADLSNIHESRLVFDARQSLARTLGVEIDDVLAVSAPYGNERGAISTELRDRCWSICLEALAIVQGRCNDLYEQVALGMAQRFNAPRGPEEGAAGVTVLANGTVTRVDGAAATPITYRAVEQAGGGVLVQLALADENIEYECTVATTVQQLRDAVFVSFDVRNRDAATCFSASCQALAAPVPMLRVRR